MSKIEVIDDFLNPFEFGELTKHINSNNFPWALSKSTVGMYDPEFEKTVCDDKYNWQMYHEFFDNSNTVHVSPAAQLINPILTKIKAIILIRAKINLNPVSHEIIEHGFHIDMYPKELANIATTCIFYLNTNNGYSKFEDGTKVESVANRMVKFPASMQHTGTTCTDQPFRQVLNINYILSEEDVDLNQHSFYKG